MRLMKAAALVLLGLLVVGCSKVPVGNVGIKVYLLGGSKGADTEELGPGRYWIGINEELYLFPTFTQTATWEGNESLVFQDRDGLRSSAALGITYSVDPTKVNSLFQKYRKGIDEITDLYLRNMVQDSLVRHASTRSIEAMYGSGKTELLAEVEEHVRKQVEPIGIRLEKLYWKGDIMLPQNVANAINSKLQAVQFAAQRQNEVAAAKAEADKAVEQARGVAQATLLQAQAEAESIRIKGKALSENPKLIEYKALEEWDGKMPQYMMGNAVPFIQVPYGSK